MYQNVNEFTMSLSIVAYSHSFITIVMHLRYRRIATWTNPRNMLPYVESSGKALGSFLSP